MRGIFVGTDRKIEVRNYEEPIHKTVGADVKGRIEFVYPRSLPNDYCFICNEDGIFQRLDFNEIGSKLYVRSMIVGNIVIFKLGLTEDEPGIIDMTDEEIERILLLLKI